VTRSALSRSVSLMYVWWICVSQILKYYVNS